MEVTAEPATFKVVLPTSLPVHVSADGTVTTAEYGVINNIGAGPIKVDSVKVQPVNGWNLVGWGEDLAAEDVGAKEFAMWVKHEQNMVQPADGRCRLVRLDTRIPARPSTNGAEQVLTP